MSQSRNDSDPFHYDIHTHPDCEEYGDENYHDFPTNGRDETGRPTQVHYHLDQKDDDPKKWSKRASWHTHRAMSVTFQDKARVVYWGPAYKHTFEHWYADR